MSVLPTLPLLLLIRVARTAVFFLVAIMVRSQAFVLAAETDHACLPRSVRLTIAVRVLTASCVNEGVFTQFQ